VIVSAEEFVSLLESGSADDRAKARYDVASIETWLDVLTKYAEWFRDLE